MVLYGSDHETIPRCRIPLDLTHSWTQKHKFLLGDEGALPPVTPINPYLGGSERKKWSIF